jgi:hypothetical protein
MAVTERLSFIAIARLGNPSLNMSLRMQKSSSVHGCREREDIPPSPPAILRHMGRFYLPAATRPCRTVRFTIVDAVPLTVVMCRKSRR